MARAPPCRPPFPRKTTASTTRRPGRGAPTIISRRLGAVFATITPSRLTPWRTAAVPILPPVRAFAALLPARRTAVVSAVVSLRHPCGAAEAAAHARAGPYDGVASPGNQEVVRTIEALTTRNCARRSAGSVRRGDHHDRLHTPEPARLAFQRRQLGRLLRGRLARGGGQCCRLRLTDLRAYRAAPCGCRALPCRTTEMPAPHALTAESAVMPWSVGAAEHPACAGPPNRGRPSLPVRARANLPTCVHRGP